MSVDSYPDVSFEARMGTVEFRVHERPHITVDDRKCVDCSVRGCITACPANLFVPTADGGILFLDEISSMPVDLQAKFLRALEERSFRRVGGKTVISVDVQVVAASNRNLQEMIAKHEFREDLYYRLKVVDLDLPALSERKVDIPDLVGYFLQRYNMSMGKNIHDLTPQALEALVNYDWPGNIRELRNALERAVLLCDEAAIDLAHLPRDLTSPARVGGQQTLPLA